jgi:hypothetical protein
MAALLLIIMEELFSISVWPQSKGIHKPTSELLAELASAPRRLHLLHLHPAEAEADGASLPARAQAESASAPRRLHLLHLYPAEAEVDGASLPARAQVESASAPRRLLPVDQAGDKESSGQMFTPLSQYFFESSGQMFIPLSQYVFVRLCGKADPHS